MDASHLVSRKGKSQAEIEALEVTEGNRQTEWEKPSFVAELFMGNLRNASLFPYNLDSHLDPAEEKRQEEFLQRLLKFARENIDGDKIDQDGQIPDSIMKGLAEVGAFGMKIPREYGGLGLSQRNYLRALSIICEFDASTAALLSAHQSIGVPQPLKLFGTPEQKKKWMPGLAAGKVSAFALTEPDVGSDPARLSTYAKLSADGSHYILNGTKIWCTNGYIADLIVVMAQTEPDPAHPKKKQITAFVIEKGTPGYEVAYRSRFLGLGGIQNAVLKFHDVKVPKENILWAPGRGLRLALATLNAGRLSIPAVSIGATKTCITEARIWGSERTQWGKPVGQHEAGQKKLADLVSQLHAMESITYLASDWVDRDSHDIRLEAAMAKLFCSETAYRIIDETLQFKGGRGYERALSLKGRGERPFPVERLLRDGRINMIVEGTSEILRLYIAREALDRHLKLAGDLLNPRASIGKKIATLFKAGAFYAAWYPWQWLGQLLAFSPVDFSVGRLGKHLRYARRTSHRLARTTFHLMLRHGPGLEKRQLQLFRLVDIATLLFAMSASIARARALQKKGQADAVAVADLFCQDARQKIAESFKNIRRNSDSTVRQVAKGVLEGRMKWLEQSL
jgi:alkylation response protein AidB-like acyl-CoA dehydrogenase